MFDLDATRKMAAERKDAKSKVRIYESFPIRRWDRWLGDAQARLYVIPADGEGAARDVLAGTQLIAGPGYGGPSGEGSSEDLAPEWAPDSQSLVFVATTGKNAAAYQPVAMHLYQVPAAGGSIQHASHPGGLSSNWPRGSRLSRREGLRVRGRPGAAFAVLSRLSNGDRRAIPDRVLVDS